MRLYAQHFRAQLALSVVTLQQAIKLRLLAATAWHSRYTGNRGSNCRHEQQRRNGFGWYSHGNPLISGF
jgi:hypothetical protein